MTKRFTRLSQLMLALGVLSSLPAHAQDVVTLQNVPPDLIQEDGAASAPAVPVDLGENTGSAPIPSAAPAPTGVAQRAAMTARTRRPPPTAAQVRQGTERAVFDRQPISVPLPVGAERLITLPAPAALHVPSDMARVARLEVIDKTIYATALVPFTSIRIVAELIDSGQQIPMDLVANATTATARSELEVFSVETPSRSAVATTAPAAPAADTAESSEKVAAPDMVELTRHAARQLYAPRRLAWATPGVSQVEVDGKPVPGLMRGANVETAPLGQWRAGNLYVTAVRVTNRSARSLELPLEDVRGKWLAVTAQHGRIGPAGTETDTTAVYLVCDRAFDACMN